MYCNKSLWENPAPSFLFLQKSFLVKKSSQLFLQSCYQLTIAFVIAFLCLTACTKTDVFEKNTSIPKYEWAYSFRPSFDFSITDTTTLYNIFIVLRHTDAYRYNNIWLNVGTQLPGDSMRYERLQVQLGNDAKGWYGTGMDDIWEMRKAISNGPVPLKKMGNYKFSLSQIMRENPLPNIMSVGMRVERVK